MRETVFGSDFGQLMAFINSTVLYWMSFLHCADKNGWKLSTNFDEECLQGKCRNYKEHNHVFLEMAWEQALFINYSGRAFLCPREDWRPRGEVCWGSGINNYRYQTPYRPLTNFIFLKASYLTVGEETIVPNSQWWEAPRALFLRELEKKNFLFSHRHLL